MSSYFLDPSPTTVGHQFFTPDYSHLAQFTTPPGPESDGCISPSIFFDDTLDTIRFTTNIPPNPNTMLGFFAPESAAEFANTIPSTPKKKKIEDFEKPANNPASQKILLPQPVHSEAPVKPKRKLTGKQMIKMVSESEEKSQLQKIRKKREKPIEPRSTEDEETFALRKMEPFVCVMFCQKCQENAHFNGKELRVQLCDRCCGRMENVRL